MLYKNKYFQFFLLLFLFEPNIFVKYSIMNSIYILGGMISFIYCIYIFIRYNKGISPFLIVLLIYRLLLFIPTFMYKGDIIKWGYQSIIIMTIGMLTSVCLKDNPKQFIKNIKNIFMLLLVINITLYLIIPNGLYVRGRIHFLGIRTRFTDYAYTALLLIILDRYMNKANFIVYSFSFFIILLNILMPSIATAIVGVLIFLSVFFLAKKLNFLIRLITLKNVFIISIILNISVIFFRVQTYFSSFIKNFLNKDVSLTGRTEIWDLSYKYILEHPIIGHGLRNDGNFVLWKNSFWQSHSQVLQFLYEGGIPLVILMIILILMIARKVDKYKGSKLSLLFSTFLLGFFVMMISEIYFYYPPIYIVLSMGYYIKYIVDIDY